MLPSSDSETPATSCGSSESAPQDLVVHTHQWQPPFGYRPSSTNFRTCECGAYGWLM